jgi:iron complex outermembrane recepter protein
MPEGEEDMPGRLALHAAVAALAFLSVVAMPAVAAEVTYTFNLPEQTLAEALRAIGRQTTTNILFVPDTVEHLTAPAIRGNYTTEQAIDRALAGTRLQVERTAPNSILVQRRARTSFNTVGDRELDGERSSGSDAGPGIEHAHGPLRLAQADGQAVPAGGQPAPVDQAVEARKADAGQRLEEVTVTATKQAAIDVNKVPISISAYGQQEMDVRGLKNIADIAAITPGLNVSQQNDFGTPQTNIEIRGIQSRTSAPTTGIYLDDTPMVGRANNVNTGMNGGYPQVFDLDRVEVLRGPQGTLFGASSEGGAVRFITKQPDLTRSSVYARSELATTRDGDPSYEVGIAGGAPLVQDKLAFRASVWYRRDGGWIDRVQPPVGAGPFTPAIDPTRPGGQVIESGANWSATKAAKLALTWAPNEWLRITPSIFYQDVYIHDAGNYDLTFSNPGEGRFAIAHSQRLPADDPNSIASLKIDAVRGDVAFASITSNYQRRVTWETDYTQYQDNAFFGDPWPLTGAPDDFGTGFYETYQNATSEELRVSSVDPTDRIAWVAGLYYEHARQQDTVFVSHPDLPALVQAIYGQSIESILGTGPYQGLWVAFDDVRTTDDQTALFGNVDFKLTPTLKGTLGVRVAYAKSHTNLHFDGSFNGGPGFFQGDETDKPVTPKAGLTWQPTANETYYVSVGKGYRVGGVNPQTNNTQPACQAALAADDLTGKLSQTYNPDSLWSYEIGAKGRLFDSRLEVQASAYHIRWNDIQQAAQITGCGFAAVFNLGTADSNGFDLSLRAVPTDSLLLGLQVAYTDAHYNTSEGKIVASGDVIGGPAISTGSAVPPWTATATAEYSFHLFDKQAYFWAEDSYHSVNTGPFSTHNPANIIVYDPQLAADPPTNVVNLRTGIRFPAADVSLFVDNVFNQHPQLSLEHTNPGDPRFQAVTLRPLTYGITATFRF